VAQAELLLERENLERRVAVLRLLWEQRSFLLRVCAYSAVCALIVALLIRSQYVSTTQLMPPDQQGGSGLGMLASLAGKVEGGEGGIGGIEGLGGVTDGLLGIKTSGDLFVGVLQSRTILDKIIRKFDLRKVYRDRAWEDARKDLMAKTDIAVDRKSGILTIKVTDRNRQRAAAIAGEYVEQLNLLMSQLNTSAAHRERVFLEGRLERVKQDLESAEKDFGEFSSKNSTLDIKDEGKAIVEAAGTLEGDLIAAQTELQGLKQSYADGNVRVRSVQARIDELRRQLQKLGGKSGGVDSAEVPDADSVYPTIRKLPLLGVRYEDLLRQAKVQEAVYETLTQEYELSKVQEAKELLSVKVLDPPSVPERKSYPPRLLITLAGGLVGLVFGIVLVLGRSKWREVDSQDPAKSFLQEVVQDLRGQFRLVSENGSGPGGQISSRRS
jgi:capsule polysaccharide export protein KpsE/RkpR